jgi:hypothetical protein
MTTLASNSCLFMFYLPLPPNRGLIEKQLHNIIYRL